MEDLTDLFEGAKDVVASLQTILRQKLAEYNDLPSKRRESCEEWIDDVYTVFRFLRKHEFDESQARDDLIKNLKLRINDPPGLDPESHYITNPVICFLPVKDKYGRPVAVLNCKHILRDESDEPLAEIKRIITGWWEIGRRYLKDVSQTQGKPVFQFILLASAEGAGFANLEHELISFFLSALHAHFPGQCGTTYITHMHWTASTLWGVVQSVLPTHALERIQRPSQQELFDMFGSEEKTPVKFGGQLETPWKASNDEILTKYVSDDLERLDIASETEFTSEHNSLATSGKPTEVDEASIESIE